MKYDFGPDETHSLRERMRYQSEREAVAAGAAPDKKGAVDALVGSLAMVPLVILVMLSPETTDKLWNKTVELSAAFGGRLLQTLAVFLLSVGLYQLRTRRRRIYAVVELSFAFVYGWVSVAPNFVSLQVVGSVYLFVRGLDNLFKKA